MATSSQRQPTVPVRPPAVYTDCRLCGSRLFYNRRGAGDRTDDMTRGVCAECQGRPEAKRFGTAPAPPTTRQTVPPPTPPPGPSRAATPVKAGPRPFNGAEKALIRTCLKAYMPAAQLLEILNSRLVMDRPEAVPFTMEQLWEEGKEYIHQLEHAGDWGELRKVIAQARKSGLLATITMQLVDDFSTVFQLSAAQRTHLRDVIRNVQEGK